MATTAAIFSTVRLSMSFSSTRPSRQPMVISSQNRPTAVAPTVCGIEAVVRAQELRDPVGDALLRAHVAEDAQRVEEDVRVPQQRAVGGPGAGPLSDPSAPRAGSASTSTTATITAVTTVNTQ